MTFSWNYLIIASYFFLKAGKVERAISKIFQENLSLHQSYDAEHLKHQATFLTETIKTKIKKFYGPRYRLICILNILQNNGQALRMASRCCWDSDKDNFTECIFEGDKFTVTCVVYGIFLE